MHGLSLWQDCDCSFGRFDSIVRTNIHTQTDRQTDRRSNDHRHASVHASAIDPHKTV